MTVVHPRVSAAGNLLIIAFFCDIAVTPNARAIVTTAGSPSGIAATARDTDARNAVLISIPNHTASTKLRTVIESIAMTRNLVKSANLLVSGVTIFSVSCISFAILPISACSPVPTTIPDPVPFVMNVPLNAMHFWSAIVAYSITGSVCLVTGTDSPVMAASSALRFLAWNSRISAGTLSPPSRITTSPGTSSLAGMTFFLLSRTTVHSGAIIFPSASTDASAFPSWIKPMIVFARTTARITTVSINISAPSQI